MQDLRAEVQVALQCVKKARLLCQSAAAALEDLCNKLQMLLMWLHCSFEVPAFLTDMAAMPLVEQHRIVTCRSAHVTSHVSGLRATCVRNTQQLSFSRAIG
jgi:hypothetical protein